MENLNVKIGMQSTKFQMAEPKKPEEFGRTVDNFHAIFKVACGPLIFDGIPCSSTLFLEITYKEAEDTHRQLLGARSFGSHLCMDYAEEAHKVAGEYCKKHHLVLNEHLNSWPVFQAIVSKT